MNILLTSVGRRSYLVKYFKEALGKSGKVFVSNSTAQSPAFLVADEHVVTPLIYDKEYIPFLLNYCKENAIDALISLFDLDLLPLSRNKSKFVAIGTQVIVSDYQFVEICNDKWKTYCYLKENNFRTPKTYISIDEARQDLSKGVIKYPVMVKPRFGMGSIAVYQADNDTELTVFYNKTRKGIENSYIKYEAECNFESGILIQEKIDGEEYGLDVMNDLKGNYCNTSIKKKLAMRSGETDCSMTVDNEMIKLIGQEMGRLSHHIGNLDIDLFLTNDNVPYVLEMNARFGGGYPFSHIADVNFPKAIILWLNNETVDPSILEPKVGVIGQKDINIVILEEC